MSEPLVSVRALSHLGITVTRLDRSVRFYREVLGMSVVFEAECDTWSRVGLALDAVVLELFSPHPGSGWDVLYPAAYGTPKIAFTVSDVDACFAAVTAAGVPTLGPVEDTGVSRLFFVLDPDGTHVQLHEFDGGQLRVLDLLGGTQGRH